MNPALVAEIDRKIKENGFWVERITTTPEETTVILKAQRPVIPTTDRPDEPPKGYELVSALRTEPNPLLWDLVFIQELGWVSLSQACQHAEKHGAKFIAMAVKSKRIELSDAEKMVGWQGPINFRLQTFTSKTVDCTICGKKIKAGTRLARWRNHFPETFDEYKVEDNNLSDKAHVHAHVDCLHKGRHTLNIFHLRYEEIIVPGWLRDKKNKYDKQEEA